MRTLFGQIKKIFKNPYTLSIIAKAVGVLVGFLFTVFQSVYLGAALKGQVQKVNSIVSISSVVCGLGIYHAYPYFKRTSDVDIMPIFLKIALIMFAFYMSASVTIIAIFNLPAKYIAALVLTPMLTYDGVVSYITLIETPNRRSVTDMVVLLTELVLLVILWLTMKPSFFIGVLVITVKDIIKALVFTFWWRKRIFVPSERIIVWLPKLIKFGFFPMLSLLMTTLNYRLDVIMLDGKVADASIGIYSVGVLLAERIWMIPDAMKGIMSSKLTKGKDASETAYVIRICNTACLFVVVAIIALGKPFLDIVFGPEYEGSYQITLVLLAGVFSLIYYKLIASYNIVMGKQVISFSFLGVGVVCNVIANLFLIPRLGIFGAGIASVISYAICSVLFIVYFCRVTHIPFGKMLFINKEDIHRIKERLGRKKE